MCGICGSVGIADTVTIEAMNAVQVHRGPDGHGVELFPAINGGPPAALGHRRLSIIDPSSRGAQPMSYADRRYWITYNGELYNYRELCKDLKSAGFDFRSECDTEVLLAMYARFGEDMLGHLNGIYAFAIWDAERRDLFLARDRLGVKPLYYTQADDVLHFASEVKALLVTLPTPSLNLRALPEFLTFLWVPDPDTMFDGIYKLPPGHCARFADGKLKVRQYWDMEFAVDEDISEAAWAEQVRETVQSAVRRQMVSDVPLGSFLSGGLDSSAITATMASAREHVTSYSVGFSEEDLAHEIVPDDLRYARQMGATLDLDHHEQILRPDIVSLLPQIVWHMDEPVADPAAISTYLICSAARERLTVILSGMGGDEVFAGYPRHLAAQLARIADWIPPMGRAGLRRAVEGRVGLGSPGRLRGPRRNLLKFLRGIDQPPIQRYLTYCSYYKGRELRTLWSEDFPAELGEADAFQKHLEYARRVSGEHWLNQMLYIDLKTFLPCLNLTYTDKMSMAASTEVRVPLLDDQVVNLCGRIPPNLKLRRTARKYIFKRSMEGLLPREIVYRPKAGFGAPLRAWLSTDLQPMVRDLLSPERITSRGFLNPDAVRTLLSDNDHRKADNALRIWSLLVLELWQQTFIDGGSVTNEAKACL